MKLYCVPDIIEGVKHRDRRALGKAITIIEDDRDGKKEILDFAYKTINEKAMVLGITGSSGAGKSTLIDKIITVYREKGKSVGVIAIDPSSPYTGGAFLGDRVRMGIHNADQEVFIRSFGSRGSLGGISRGAKESLYLYKAYGFDVIIIESLGVGQAETDITNYVDVTAVVLAPGNGDDIQLSKAGTQEIADVFVINKADKPEAKTLYLQLTATFGTMFTEEKPSIIQTIAIKNQGITQLTELFNRIWQRRLPVRHMKWCVRVENEIFSGTMHYFEEMLHRQIQKMADEVIAGKQTPFEAIEKLVRKIHIDND